MTYIISDIHGCYDSYMELLKRIEFENTDELYILGDAMDRGPEPIKVMQDIMERSNVIYILGNHDFAMYMIMKRLCVEITSENCESHLTVEDMESYQMWLLDGGQTTAEQFRKLGRYEQMDMLDYIAEASAYEIVEHDDHTYILVHAGLGGFSPTRELDDYDLYELIGERVDYTKRYYPDKNVYLVTGHTPTISIPGWEKPEVYQDNGHIALDCGCVFGGRLAAFCIETGEVTYVDKIDRDKK